MPPPDSELGQWFATHVQPHVPVSRAWLHSRFRTEDAAIVRCRSPLWVCCGTVNVAHAQRPRRCASEAPALSPSTVSATAALVRYLRT